LEQRWCLGGLRVRKLLDMLLKELVLLQLVLVRKGGEELLRLMLLLLLSTHQLAHF